MNAPFIRVSRKRSADPHEALILQSKRAKQASPVVFTLFKADGTEQELNGARFLDLPAQVLEAPDLEPQNDNPLGFVHDEAVGAVGEVEKSKEPEVQQVSLNGQILRPVADVLAQEDIVYDYYAILERGGGANDNFDIDMDGVDVRFANRDELDLGGEEDSEGHPADDDDDSNDEDNWRNDYPDEDSYDEDSDHGDPYGMLEPGRWHAGDEYSVESFNRRLQNLDLNDERYEAYYEGDDTDDEDGDS